jgi:polar amino acid transport system substrate-binding protein
MKRGLWVGLVAALVGLSIAGAASAGHADDVLAKVKSKGELVVGTEMQFAPFDFLENGAQVGLNADLFREIGKELGVKVTFVDLPWDGVLPGLEAKKFDVVAGPVTITKERMTRYQFTLPIADATVALLKRAGDDSVMKPKDIAGKAVGGGKSSAQLDQLKLFAETLPGKADIREYVDNNQAYADLAAGRIVAVANSLPNISYVAAQRPDTFAVVTPPFGQKVYFGYVGRPDEDSKTLMAAIDDALRKIEADGRMEQIQKKWFGLKMDLPDSVPEPGF